MPFKWGNPGCPCCDVVTPPLPVCSCPASECFPPGRGQPSSIKVEIEFQDSFTIVEVNKEQFTSGACNGKWITQTRTKSFSGASGFNGTYDIGYYLLEEGTFVSANPLVDPCGYWFYPVITTQLTVFDQLTNVYDDNCAAGSTQTFANGVVDSHIVVNPIDSFVNQFAPSFVTHSGVRIAKNLGALINPPQMTSSETRTPYECNGGGSPIVDNYSTSIPNSTPTAGTGLGVLESVIGLSTTGLRGRLVNFSELIEVNGQYGRMYQYAKNGDSLTPCEILPEEGIRVLNAYSYSVNPTRRQYSINFDSYQCRTKVIFNA